MYRYTDSDRGFVRARAAQFRDQLQRHLARELPDDDFRPLRLQNGWYVQRHAPMLRVAVPYGGLSSRQLRQLARIARDFDLQDAGLASERGGFGHFSTRQNLQFNWIPLARAADVMDLLAEVDMHGIQTSGNCIRNITTDALAGIAPDETVDPRPYCEILRQWSTLHPEFAFLPRKFKIAISGATEDRAAAQEGPLSDYKPYVPADSTQAEFTMRALVLGLVMSVILGMATPVWRTVVQREKEEEQKKKSQ